MEENEWIMKPLPSKKKKSTQNKSILLIRIGRILSVRKGYILMANFRELNVSVDFESLLEECVRSIKNYKLH